MVEKDGEGAQRRVCAVDWASLYERWQAGESEQGLAEAFNLVPETVKWRCRWIDKVFPRFGRVQMLASLVRRLEEADSALTAGEALDAERRAKAVLALIRAARALETWTMDGSKPNAETPAGDTLSDGAYARAELERRLLHLIDFEEKRQSRAGPALRDPAERSGGDASPLDLGDMGEAGPDPA
jgi:hypothetical protein